MGAVNTASESIVAKRGNVTAVIDMRMGKQNRVDTGGIERERRPVPKVQFFQTLEQPAINQQSFAIVFEQ